MSNWFGKQHTWIVQIHAQQVLLKNTPAHITKLSGIDTTIVITTQSTGLRHKRPETGFDWQAFGQELRAKF